MLAEKIVTTIHNLFPGKKNTFIPLHEPSFNGNEWKYVKECLDSNFVSSVGKFVDQFEKEIATYTGSRFVIATVNGTSALHVALILAGVKSNDEVLIPSLSFVATANAVCYIGAIPHFLDTEERTLGMDPNSIYEYLKEIIEFKSDIPYNKKTGSKISAIVPMHTFGHPVNLDGLLKISNDFRIPLVEDSAESLGSYYSGKHTGTFGKLGILSFNGNKTITTGGGGAILTSEEDLAKRAKHLTTTAKLPHKWEYTHDQIGYNYRMPNLNAALGLAQLEELPSFLENKRNLYNLYHESFKDYKELKIQKEPENSKSNYWLQTIVLERGYELERDAILDATNSAVIMTRPSWTLLHKLEPFKNFPKMELKISESLEKRIINIPSSSSLGKL